MKDKVRISVLYILTLILSTLNLYNGLVFNTTDKTEINDIYTGLEEKSTIEKFKAPTIKTVNIPKKTNTKTTTSSAKTITKTPSNMIVIAGKNVKLKPTDCNVMPNPDYTSANYCNFRGSDSLFVYGHNISNIFGQIKNLSVGSTFKIILNGQTTTYKITDSFALEKSVLNSNASMRASIYKGTYLGKSDITIQTCEGKNDVNRRYIKAVLI